ncbi:HNH endonuclease signature motif containing protein [Nitrobacter sp.]|uniref:HNH endonuclease n=1 Tax=Nitrobacter sp. TaxID=29420 RepID=UPI0029CABAB4|nr:HNH endonuclease signature motif containing protein [Nitrobacter sp.]
MNKLPPPQIPFADALSEAVSGVGDPALCARYNDAFANAAAIEAHYAQVASSAGLHALPRLIGPDDPVVHGTLRKSELTKLYTQYFVPQGKPARAIYDKVKVSAGGKCPLCGGIGHVRTLDHYLPKANFPLYSVLPANLVPCCRDCNSEKLNAFANQKADQTLHPYFDHVRFFQERWIQARVIPTSPPVVEFFVEAPAAWHPEDRSRVAAHFLEYGLGDKFSVEAAADLPETIRSRATTLAGHSPAEYSAYLLEKSQNIDLPVNNWRRVMFAALATDHWFCHQVF